MKQFLSHVLAAPFLDAKLFAGVTSPEILHSEALQYIVQNSGGQKYFIFPKGIFLFFGPQQEAFVQAHAMKKYRLEIFFSLKICI